MGSNVRTVKIKCAMRTHIEKMNVSSLDSNAAGEKQHVPLKPGYLPWREFMAEIRSRHDRNDGFLQSDNFLATASSEYK